MVEHLLHAARAAAIHTANLRLLALTLRRHHQDGRHVRGGVVTLDYYVAELGYFTVRCPSCVPARRRLLDPGVPS